MDQRQQEKDGKRHAILEEMVNKVKEHVSPCCFTRRLGRSEYFFPFRRTIVSRKSMTKSLPIGSRNEWTPTRKRLCAKSKPIIPNDKGIVFFTSYTLCVWFLFRWMDASSQRDVYLSSAETRLRTEVRLSCCTFCTPFAQESMQKTYLSAEPGITWRMASIYVTERHNWTIFGTIFGRLRSIVCVLSRISRSF